jgi:outer membrane lipoprotein-sorting protein
MCIWLIWLLVLAFPAWTCAAEFSATMSTQGADTPGTQGKIYVKGNKMRLEFSHGHEAHISIMQPDKQLVWMLMPAEKIYMEMPMTPQTKGKMLELPKDKARTKLLGSETVNGYATDKYETVEQVNGQTSKHYMWVAKKLGIPIKMTSLDGAFSMEYQNIQEGGVPDTLFEVPAGYQKMTMPAGMPMK